MGPLQNPVLLFVFAIQVMSAQSVVLSLGSDSGAAGSAVTIPITLTSSGGAQSAGLQWSFSYPAGITGVTVVAGTAVTNAQKLLACSGDTCLVYGLDTRSIADGLVATATFQLSGTASGTIPISLTNVTATTAAASSIPASGGSGSVMVSGSPSSSLSTVVCLVGSIATPGSTSCTVTLTAAAPGGGFQVALSSNNASLSVPTSVTVAAGSTSANFQIVASTVALRQTVTLTASLSNSSVSTSVTVKPQVATLTGLLNPASNQLGQACSPDAIATLLGSGFTSQPLQTAPASSWPMRLAGVQVNINDQPAALLAVSDSFIHFQCPALAPRTNLRIVVQPESAPPPDALATVMQEATPSVFELDTTHQGAVMIAGTDLVASAATDEGPSRPAKQGEYISIYADGLGSLSENLPPGQPAPLDPLIWAMAPIKVVIGDSNVVLSPSFAGLTPGGISLFVVNVQLTSAVPTGSSIPIYLNVTLSDGTVISTNTVRIAIANADVQ